jgi:hypothetical protein
VVYQEGGGGGRLRAINRYNVYNIVPVKAGTHTLHPRG